MLTGTPARCCPPSRRSRPRPRRREIFFQFSRHPLAVLPKTVTLAAKNVWKHAMNAACHITACPSRPTLLAANGAPEAANLVPALPNPSHGAEIFTHGVKNRLERLAVPILLFTPPIDFLDYQGVTSIGLAPPTLLSWSCPEGCGRRLRAPVSGVRGGVCRLVKRGGVVMQPFFNNP